MYELRNKVKEFSDKENFIVQLIDEMKIQENLVWDKHNGEFIGYVDFGDIDRNYATLSKVTTVESHVLAVLLILLNLVLQILQQMTFQLLKCFRFYGKPFLYVKKVH